MSVKIDTSCGEQTDSMGHVTEAIDSLVCIGAQLSKQKSLTSERVVPSQQCYYNGLNGFLLLSHTGQSCLDGSDESRDHASTSIKSRANTNSTECGDSKPHHNGHVLANVRALVDRRSVVFLISPIRKTISSLCILGES